MFRLLSAAALAAVLLTCGSVARGTAFCDTGGAVTVTTCAACGGPVAIDEATFRRGPCACDRPRPADLRRTVARR